MVPTYSFKADGQWYSCGFKNPSVDKGDDVSFDFESTKFGNQVDMNTIKVKKMDGSVADTGGKTAYKPRAYGAPQQQNRPFPIPLLHGDRSIVRQNALTNARETVTFMADAGAITTDDLVREILRIARQFEAYSAGDVERMAAENVHEEK